MKKTNAFIAICLLLCAFVTNPVCGLAVAASDNIVRIRRVASSPLCEGQRIENLWAKADTLSGFIVSGGSDVAIDDSAVQFLYDERFLYASFRGFFKKGCARPPADQNAPSGDNFELSVAPLNKNGSFIRFIFFKSGQVKCAAGGKTGMRELRMPDNLRLHISESNDNTLYNVKIPISSLGLGGIAGGTQAAIFIARSNHSFKTEHHEDSAWGAFAKPSDRQNTERWGKVRFVKEADSSSPVTHSGPHNQLNVNLFANPEFDVPDRAWAIVGKGLTHRCETMPMSREWIIRTSGNSYQFLQGIPREYERDTDYTLEVQARGYGGESVMNILELFKRDGDGKVREGTTIAKQVLLGESFRTYYFPFRSTGLGTPLFMLFYKAEPKAEEGRGIDIASVRMYKGKIKVFDIRKITRSNRKTPLGAGIPVPANPYGRSAKKARGLVINKNFSERREILEVFEGTGVDVDILSTTALNQDIYYTDDDADSIKRRLEKKEYDFYCILSSVAARIGEIVASKITEAVENGAGLYCMYNAQHGNLSKLLSTADFKPLGENHPLAISFPANVEKALRYSNPGKTFLVGHAGRGRILRESVGRMGVFKHIMNPESYGISDFPFSRFADPTMLKMFLYLARKDAADPSTVKKTIWSAVDSTGMVRKSGEAADAASASAEAKSACTVSGRYALALKSVDGLGRTVDWKAEYFDAPGPSLALEGIRTSCSANEPAVFKGTTDQTVRTATIRWTLEDFSGRVIESATARVGEKFEVPVKALFTNKGTVRAYLVSNGSVKAVARADVFARDKDWERFKDDFCVAVWGQGTGVSRDSYPLVDSQLEQAGVLCQSLPVAYYSRRRNLAFSMASGMAVGGGYAADYTWFYPQPLNSSNNRSQFGPVNTEKGRKKIAATAAETAARLSKYGPISYTVCDEPNLSLRFTKDEPDEEPENVAEFRRRMEAKYTTLSNYNKLHRTSHTSFADIKPVRIEDARRSGNYPEYIEWRNFNTDRWCEAIRLVSDSGKLADPTFRLSLFNSFGQTAVSGNDYWKLLTKAGLGISHEYTSMVYMRRDAIYNFDEFYRSFRPDLRVWGFTGYNIDATQIRFTPWWFAAHRYGGFTWYSVMNWDFRFLDQPTLALTRDAQDVKAALENSRVQNGLGKLFLTCDWAPRNVAVYYSHDSLLVATLLGKEKVSYEIVPGGPLHDYMYSRQGLQFMLEDFLYQFDFVAPEQVMTDRLKGYKVLFMPRIISLSDAEIAKLKAFVAAGGKIVADVLPGDYNELGVKRPVNPLLGCAVSLTGGNFDDLSVQSRSRTHELLSRSAAQPVLRSEGVVDTYGREAMHFTDGVNYTFIVMRQPLRSKDDKTQIFRFPKKGHVYDVRTGRYVGFTDSVSAAVPRGDACVWAVLPNRVGALRISIPEKIVCGKDLVADINLEHALGKGVFHVEVISPTGECRFHMKRNVQSRDGKAQIAFRMAHNDMTGVWTLRVTDAVTQASESTSFKLVGK